MRARIVNVGPDDTETGVTISFEAEAGEGRGPVPAGFDPWTATFDVAAQLGATGTPAFAQWSAVQGILQLRDLIEKEGDGIALLMAISIVARHGLVMPPWLAAAYLNRWNKFYRYECASLDEAFDHKAPTERERLATYKKQRLLPAVSHHLVAEINANPTQAIDDALFEKVATLLRIGIGPCRDLYYEGVRDHNYQDLKQLKRLLKRIKSSGEARSSPSIKRTR